MPEPTWVPLEEAVRQLNSSPDAVRKRLRRGTLPGEKRDGHWFVQLATVEAGTPPANGHAAAGAPSTSHDAPRHEPPARHDKPSDEPWRAVIERQDNVIAHLRSLVSTFHGELAERSRELAAERERFDVIHREALGRIEALSAGQERVDASVSAAEARSATIRLWAKHGGAAGGTPSA